MDTNQLLLLETLLQGRATRAAGALAAHEMQHNKRKIDHRQLPRSTRRVFRHDEALACSRRDYLGDFMNQSTPLLGAEFQLMFRLSIGQFQELTIEDVMASNISFFVQINCQG
jgi:hypothetical protein